MLNVPTRSWLSIAGGCAVVLMVSPARASIPRQERVTLRQVSLKSITVSPDGRVVSIEADGPLPEPVSGRVQAPPRIFIDLPGIMPGTAPAVTAGAGVVAGARVALNNADPLITRVVLDLKMTAAFRVDSTARGNGRITVSLDGLSPSTPQSPGAPARGASPTPPLATAPAPPAVTSRPPAVAPAVAAARERYLQQVSPSLARLQELVPVLTSIEKLAPSAVAADLQAHARTFETISRELAAIKPPTPVMVQHDMLLRACHLGARAARLRADSLPSGDPSTTANASSAAAGAVMLLDRARQELSR